MAFFLANHSTLCFLRKHATRRLHKCSCMRQWIIHKDIQAAAANVSHGAGHDMRHAMVVACFYVLLSYGAILCINPKCKQHLFMLWVVVWLCVCLSVFVCECVRIHVLCSVYSIMHRSTTTWVDWCLMHLCMVMYVLCMCIRYNHIFVHTNMLSTITKYEPSFLPKNVNHHFWQKMWTIIFNKNMNHHFCQNMWTIIFAKKCEPSFLTKNVNDHFWQKNINQHFSQKMSTIIFDKKYQPSFLTKNVKVIFHKNVNRHFWQKWNYHFWQKMSTIKLVVESIGAFEHQTYCEY